MLQYIIIQYIRLIVLCWTDHVEYLEVMGYLFIYSLMVFIYLFYWKKCILCPYNPWKETQNAVIYIKDTFLLMCQWSLSLFILCFLCCDRCTLLSQRPVKLLYVLNWWVATLSVVQLLSSRLEYFQGKKHKKTVPEPPEEKHLLV